METTGRVSQREEERNREILCWITYGNDQTCHRSRQMFYATQWLKPDLKLSSLSKPIRIRSDAYFCRDCICVLFTLDVGIDSKAWLNTDREQLNRTQLHTLCQKYERWVLVNERQTDTEILKQRGLSQDTGLEGNREVKKKQAREGERRIARQTGRETQAVRL